MRKFFFTVASLFCLYACVTRGYNIIVILVNWNDLQALSKYNEGMAGLLGIGGLVAVCLAPFTGGTSLLVGLAAGALGLIGVHDAQATRDQLKWLLTKDVIMFVVYLFLLLWTICLAESPKNKKATPADKEADDGD